MAPLLPLSPLLLSAATEQPLIDLDGTVFIQLGIFLVLLVILRALVFKPFLRLLDEREKRTSGARAETERLLADAAAKVQAYEASIQSAKLAALDDRAKIRATGAGEARSILEAARQKTQRSLEDARKDLAKDVAQSRQELSRRATELGRAVAEKLLARS
jgi:F-type H+-transporting ATPase subunit b